MNKETRQFIYGLILLFFGSVSFATHFDKLDTALSLTDILSIVAGLAMVWIGIRKIDATT